MNRSTVWGTLSFDGTMRVVTFLRRVVKATPIDWQEVTDRAEDASAAALSASSRSVFMGDKGDISVTILPK